METGARLLYHPSFFKIVSLTNDRSIRIKSSSRILKQAKTDFPPTFLPVLSTTCIVSALTLLTLTLQYDDYTLLELRYSAQFFCNLRHSITASTLHRRLPNTPLVTFQTTRSLLSFDSKKSRDILINFDLHSADSWVDTQKTNSGFS
jgi:hypothetical protein